MTIPQPNNGLLTNVLWYLKASDFFIEKTKKNFLNVILDKVSKVSRNNK